MTATQLTARAQRVPSDYAALLAEVRAAGLLSRSVLTYLPRLLTMGVMSAAGVALFLRLGDSRWQLALAAYSGIVLAQLGFLGHDAGHQQISRSKSFNDTFGTLLSAFGVGLSYRWWVDKHNRHHRNPNQVGRDPDIERGVLAWTPDQAQRQRGLLRIVAQHQSAVFFPLLLLEGWNLHVASIRALRNDSQSTWLEGALLALHVLVGLTLLLVVLSPLRALEFVAIQQSVFGFYIGCSFAPNHKGMPILDDTSPLDFLRRQVVTSRNISGGRVLAVMFGGLNYQIEHHLFPSMPSPHLARCQPMVRTFCAAHFVPYTEATLSNSYAQSLRSLREVCPSGST